MSLPLPQDTSNDKQQQQKKPRHRHSPAQLAALNELFEQDEHPPLELRSALAERLGMETKTVNAWFQNKRASSKKRSRAAPHDSHSSPASHIPSRSHHGHPRLIKQSGTDGDERHTSIDSAIPSDYLALTPPLYRDYPESNHAVPNTEMPLGRIVAATQDQIDQLRRHHARNPHPTADQRQILAELIGMPYQKVTNWFQNHRTLTGNERDHDQEEFSSNPSTPPSSDHQHGELRTYSAFPPPSNHPSLGLPPQHLGYHSAFATAPRVKRSPSPSPSIDERPPKRSSLSRYAGAPYSNSSLSSGSRPRRSRPEPYQLDALKQLFEKTPTPTIEERSALALEVGMDVSKVTNWFRNLRQTARKHSKRSDSFDDDGYESVGHGSTFRSVSPTFHSSASSASMDIEGDDYDLSGPHSDVGSDDECQEAVTPPPESAVAVPAPATSASSTPSSSSRISISQLTVAAVDYASLAELEGISLSQYSGVKIEDALLLLSFHQNSAVHIASVT